jgi:DNA-binding NarL/FixJ family response regulator
MPRTVNRARTAASQPLPQIGLIVVLGEDDPARKISAALAQEQLGFSCFDDVAALQDAGLPEPGLIVLFVEDTSSGLGGRIEPLTQMFAQTPIVVVCSSIERWGVREALMSGASGVVLGDDVDLALAPSIRAVMAGQTCVPRRHQRQIEPPALSSREKQILGLVVMSYTNSQIAEQLFLAESTVKSHLSSAFGKLGVRSRNDAVHLILDPERGLGMGILALGGEPMESRPATAR